MQIKRVIAGGLAALTAGATLALGAGAVTLDEFVKVSGNTMTSPYIVIGDNAAAEDTLAGADLGVALAGHATKDATIPGSTSVSASGGVLVTSDLNKTYLDSNMNLAKSSLTFSDLPVLLETKSFTDTNSTTINYAQRIDLHGVPATYGKPTGETVPSLYMSLGTSVTPFNLTVNFIGGLDSEAVTTNSKMTLFGQEFSFGPTHNAGVLEFYSTKGAQSVYISGVTSEESVDMGGGVSHTFKIVGWGQETDPQGVYLQVNGVAPDVAEWRERSTYLIPGTTTKVYVNDVSIISTGAQEKQVSVQLFVGTDKLTLTNASYVSKNDESTNSLVALDSVAPKINAMTVTIHPQDDTYIKGATDSADAMTFTDPIFGAVTLVLDDMNPGMTSSARDLVSVTASSTQVKLTYTNKDGSTYSEIPVAYANATNTFYRTKDASYIFTTQECSVAEEDMSLKKGDYFVVSSGDYSYVLTYENNYVDSTTDTKNYVTLTDVSTGTKYKVYLDTTDNYLRIGSLAFLVSWDKSTKTGKKICVDLDGSGTFANTSVTIKTQSGQIVTLPQTAPGAINITETPLYTVSGSNDPLGGSIDVQAAYSTSGGVTYTVSDNVTLEQHGSDYEWSDVTAYGTYAHSTGDSNGKKVVNFYIPGQRPGYVNLAIGTDPSIGIGATAGGTVKEAVPIKNSIGRMESSIDATASLDRDLVLIGGPCANGLVATLLEMSAEKPTCVSDFTALYPNEGVIKVVSDAFGSGQKALVVAGVNRDTTRSLAEKVMQGGDLGYSA